MSSRTDAPFWQNRQTFLKEHTHSRKQYLVYVGVYVGAFVLSKKIVCSVTKACLQSLSVLFKKFVCSFKKVYMFFQKELSILSKKCVCSVKEVCLLFQKGFSVPLKKGCLFFQKGRYVYSVKEVFCSVKEVCLFFQKVLSALSDRYIGSFRKVCLFCQSNVSVMSMKWKNCSFICKPALSASASPRKKSPTETRTTKHNLSASMYTHHQTKIYTEKRQKEISNISLWSLPRD